MKIRQKRADCPYYANLYAYAANTPVRYSDPTGMFDFDTNTIEAGDTLSQIAKDCNTRYGTNYTADDLQGFNSDSISDKNKIYAGNHLNLGKAEDVQKRAADYTSRATSSYTSTTSASRTKLWDVAVGKIQDGLVRSLYTSGIIDHNLEDGQLNFTADIGVAEYGFQTQIYSLFGGNFKFKIDGTLGAFTGQGSVGIKDFAIGCDGDISMLKGTINLHVSLLNLGYSGKIGIEGFLGGLAGGVRKGFSLYNKKSWGMGFGISLSPGRL